MNKSEKKKFTTRLEKELLRKLKVLSAYEEKPVNELLREAIQDLLRKYEKKR